MAPQSADQANVVIRWKAEGGLCATGQVCSASYEIRDDGTWLLLPDAARGRLTSDTLKRLTDAVTQQADSLRDLPRLSTASCPSAVDGSDITISVVSGAEQVSVSNCDVRFDPDNPVISAWAAAQTEISSAGG